MCVIYLQILTVLSYDKTSIGFILENYIFSQHGIGKNMQKEQEKRQMYKECHNAGTRVCLFVDYEKLASQTRETTENILNFLNIVWREDIFLKNKFF